MIDLTTFGRPASGILTIAALEERGIDARKRRQLLDMGELTRIRNGWFASPGADGDVVRAVRIGGRMTGPTLLNKLGLWVMPDTDLHVAMRRNASRLRSPDNRAGAWSGRTDSGVCLKWHSTPWDPPRGASVDTVNSAISHLVRCRSLESAIVTIDSALNTKREGVPVLTMSGLQQILAELPDKYGVIADRVDPRAQSGLETLSRLRLRRRKIRVQTQAYIAGVGYVDVLIGDRLVLELDSRAHHLGDNYERDRARDLELFRQGFLVIRVSYRRVMYDWPAIEEAILAAVRRGDHVRRSVHDRLGLAQRSQSKATVSGNQEHPRV